MKASELILTFKTLQENLFQQVISNLINQFTQQTASYRQNPTAHANAFIQQIEGLKSSLSFLYSFDDQQMAILKAYEFDKYSNPNYLNDIQQNIRNTPQGGFNIQSNLFQEINQFRNKVQQAFQLLQPIPILSPEIHVEDNEGLVEIIFDGKVDIKDFVSGKDQFSDWFQILDGYSRFLSGSKEDFIIIDISKSSPTKIKVKTKLEFAALVLTIVTGLIQIEQRITQDRLIIEQIKKRDLVSDSLHQQYIKEAEGNLSKKIETEVNRLVSNELEKRQLDGEVKSFFKKSVEQQHLFIINGGDVKIYLNDPTKTEQSKQLELMKKEIKELKSQVNGLQLQAKTDTTSTETKEGDI